MITKEVAYSYFQSVISKLTFDEVTVLTELANNNATSHFTSMTKQSVAQVSTMSEFRLKQVFNRLQALDFLQITQSGKERILFLTPYGEKAIRLFITKAKESEVLPHD